MVDKYVLPPFSASNISVGGRKKSKFPFQMTGLGKVSVAGAEPLEKQVLDRLFISAARSSIAHRALALERYIAMICESFRDVLASAVSQTD